MQRKGRKFAVSSPEGRASSSSSERADSSTSQPRAASKRPKTGPRTVNTLTDEQLDRKRANDREAQRKIRQKNKEKVEYFEAQLAQKDETIAHLSHENQSLREYYGYSRGAEAMAASVDSHRQSMVSDSNSSWQQHPSRRPSQAEGTTIHGHTTVATSSLAPPNDEIPPHRSSGFSEPPSQYRNNYALRPRTPVPTPPIQEAWSSAGYAQSQNTRLIIDSAPFAQGPVIAQPVSYGLTRGSGPFPTPDGPYPQAQPKMEQHSPQPVSEHYTQWITDRSTIREPIGSQELVQQQQQQYAYTAITHRPPDQLHIQSQGHPPAHYPQYSHPPAYAQHPAPPPAQRYTDQTPPHYGPIVPYPPQQLSPSIAHDPGYEPGPGPQQRDPYNCWYPPPPPLP